MGERTQRGRVADFLHRLIKEELDTLISTTIGTVLTCFSIIAFMMPYKFASGGVTGVALITNYLWGLSPVWVITVGNALLLLWAGWKIEKGVGRTVEFKGLKAQYLFLFAGGLLATFLLVVVCYMCGMDQYLCLGLGATGTTLVVWQTFALNRRFGRYGLMKRAAVRKLALKYAPDNTEQQHAAEIDGAWSRFCMLEMSIAHMTGKQAIELVAKRR